MAPLDLDPARTAVLLIDLQRDWFADAELERCREDLVAACCQIATAAREVGAAIVLVRTEHDPDGGTWTLSMREDGQGVVLAGSEGAAQVDGLDEVDVDEVVVKTRDSAFFGTDLAARLAERGVDAVVLCGVSTEACVAATATDAFAHDLRAVLVEDATASIEWRLHDQTLARLGQQYRQPVVPADEVVGALRSAGRR